MNVKATLLSVTVKAFPFYMYGIRKVITGYCIAIIAKSQLAIFGSVLYVHILLFHLCIIQDSQDLNMTAYFDRKCFTVAGAFFNDSGVNLYID